jgi:hypothetical protein
MQDDTVTPTTDLEAARALIGWVFWNAVLDAPHTPHETNRDRLGHGVDAVCDLILDPDKQQRARDAAEQDPEYVLARAEVEQYA